MPLRESNATFSPPHANLPGAVGSNHRSRCSKAPQGAGLCAVLGLSARIAGDCRHPPGTDGHRVGEALYSAPSLDAMCRQATRQFRRCQMSEAGCGCCAALLPSLLPCGPHAIHATRYTTRDEGGDGPYHAWRPLLDSRLASKEGSCMDPTGNDPPRRRRHGDPHRVPGQGARRIISFAAC